VPPSSFRGGVARIAQLIRCVPKLVSAPSLRAVCLDNCKTSHTLRILRMANELLRPRSFEWEPKTIALKHLLNGSWPYSKNAFRGWDQDKMSPPVDRTPSMNSPTRTSR
jgi:hypothetical protein